ncbi:von Willebrand factor type A domain-containing protein [Kytococcus aerolatus]|uniref:von Willebrand factor type A domain-containing protein n=1 Tax=Kytococcus aerolatus TaxID=592308 RepID=A0A212U526_9MICO|nr:VWA domain-containing protein [Kytococcus aerolatus]SNC73358.1 von Willebrand factor type A domain-containing protein [Kytococcus aerolatus]
MKTQPALVRPAPAQPVAPSTTGDGGPRQRGRRVPRLLAVPLALALAGCAAEAGPTQDTAPSAPVSSTPGSGASQDGAAGPGAGTSAASSGGVAPGPAAPQPVETPAGLEADHLVESTFLLASGERSGKDLDAERAAAAVVAAEPGPREWEDAVMAQVQGDLSGPMVDLLGAGEGVAAPEVGELDLPPLHVAVVLDASGSMRESAGGGRTRMEAARQALDGFAAGLPRDATLSVRTYGQGGDASRSGRADSCRSTQRVAEGRARQLDLAGELARVEPTGWTPLARGLEAAGKDLPTAGRSVVYVVTDGLETCGGDPVAAATELSRGPGGPDVHVIGFGLAEGDWQLLEDVAEAGRGEYTSVGTGDELANLLADQRELLEELRWEAGADAAAGVEGQVETLTAGARELATDLRREVDAQEERALAVVDALAAESATDAELLDGLRNDLAQRHDRMRHAVEDAERQAVNRAEVDGIIERRAGRDAAREERDAASEELER